MVAKLLLILAFSPSIAVSMPTNAIIPKAMIDKVSVALTLLPLMEAIANLIFISSSERKLLID
jgi:hypothetical protein